MSLLGVGYHLKSKALRYTRLIKFWRRGWDSNPTGLLITRKLLKTKEARNARMVKNAGVGDAQVTWNLSLPFAFLLPPVCFCVAEISSSPRR
jgi:hypothetical protein